MKYHFRLHQSFEAAARRIATEQIRLAERQLSHTAAAAQARGVSVHEARKCLKRVRALLRLLQPSLRSSDFRRENVALRDIARELSGTRDLQVMIETLAKLKTGLTSNPPRMMPAPGLAEYIDHASLALTRRLADVHEDKAGSHGKILDHLRQARHRWRRIELSDQGFRAVASGLERTYAQGRAALSAIRLDSPDEDYHELRKHVQSHWRHMLLLQMAWPETLHARAVLARQVSQLLGDDHDLAVIAAMASDNPPAHGTAENRKQLIALCQTLQGDLRHKLQPLALRLYADEPAQFRKRIRDYWSQAVRRSASEVDENEPRAVRAPRSLRPFAPAHAQGHGSE